MKSRRRQKHLKWTIKIARQRNLHWLLSLCMKISKTETLCHPTITSSPSTLIMISCVKARCDFLNLTWFKSRKWTKVPLMTASTTTATTNLKACTIMTTMMWIITAKLRPKRYNVNRFQCILVRKTALLMKQRISFIIEAHLTTTEMWNEQAKLFSRIENQI